MLKIYGIKTCDSVRKAIKYLNANEIPYELIDYKKTSIDDTLIRSWLKKTDIKTLFNTRGTTYRTLKLKDLELTEEDKISWLARENMLIKRPVISYEDHLIVGYQLPLFESLLSKNENSNVT